ncbi:uncharacterized protein LOC127279449 [Leptopilina boulardi]|uniref:uncharacterized protein LOC127279449 n=1 Tax=Leptopilina boulardi TaxID=63433 RepID=UPI0021F5C3F5|nr:uncharacterized protein LOC127279449 [Leptopilina boulardi]
MNKGIQETFALPFVYALLESKEQTAYSKVFQITQELIQKNKIHFILPQIIMSDFELAIVNAAEDNFGKIVRCCLFHLCQNIFRRVQNEGLQQQYNDENDRSIKHATQMMCALTFVPPNRVSEFFDILVDDIPEDFDHVADYFEVTYVRGKAARGRRRAVNVRYPPKIWNQYDAVLQNISRTNNASEGWHNRFRVVTGRDHPSLYAFFRELQNEQGDTDTMLRQLSIGQIIKKSRDKKRQMMEDRIFNIVNSYETFLQKDNILGYLKAIGYHLLLITIF